jgi:hypothetical protein
MVTLGVTKNGREPHHVSFLQKFLVQAGNFSEISGKFTFGLRCLCSLFDPLRDPFLEEDSDMISELCSEISDLMVETSMFERLERVLEIKVTRYIKLPVILFLLFNSGFTFGGFGDGSFVSRCIRGRNSSPRI